MKRCLYFLLYYFVFLYGCQDQAEFSVRDYSKIVFLSNREAPKGKYDVFMMNPDGSNQTNLTPDLNSINALSKPQLSPDGQNILIQTVTDKHRLQLLNINNRELFTVMELNSLDNIQSSFSPTGEKIAFVLKIGNIQQIHIINTDGSKIQNISNLAFNEFHPSFSSDGSRIVCISKQKGNFVLTVLNLDGSERKDLFKQKTDINFPTFSPDGEYIVFITYKNKKAGLYTIKSDGSDIRLVTNNKVIAARPQITPDGSKIIFLNRQRGRKYTDIGVIDRDGEGFINLTSGLNLFNQLPHIIPNGKSVVFHSVKFNGCDIYSVDIDGNNLVNLSIHPKIDQFPSL